MWQTLATLWQILATLWHALAIRVLELKPVRGVREVRGVRKVREWPISARRSYNPGSGRVGSDCRNAATASMNNGGFSMWGM